MTRGSLLRVVRSSPVTIALAGLLVVGSLVAGRLLAQAGDLSPLPFDALVSLFAVSQPLTFLASLLGILVVVPPVERLMGSTRTAIAFVVSGLVGYLVGAAIVATTSVAGIEWADDAGSGMLLDPVVGVAGVLMTASAFARHLWQRRIRILGFGVLALLALYSGNAADLYRVAAATVGLTLGMVLAPDSWRATTVRSSSGHEIRTLLGFIVVATAVSPLITLWTRTPHGPLHVLSRLLLDGESPAGTDSCPVDVGTTCSAALTHGIHGPGGILLSILPLVVLGVAGWGIFRGRRVAALVAAAITALFGVLELTYFTALRLVEPGLTPDAPAVRGEEIVGAVVAVVVPLGVAVALLLNLRRFPISPGRRAGRLFLVGVVVSFVSAASVYVLGCLLLADQFEPRATLSSILAMLPERFVPSGFLHQRLTEYVATGATTKLLQQWTGPAFWTALLIGTVVVVARRSEGRSPVTQDLVRQLLRTGGQGSLSFMATWDGNAYWRHPGGAGVIAYRRSGRVVIVLGDPIGPDDRRADTIADFIDYCAARGDIVGFYAVGDEAARAFSDLGWQLLVIGEDARIDAATFTLQGGRWKDIRTSLNRAAREGVEARWTSWSELATGMRSQLVDISEEWLSGKDIPEMGFTLGGIDELRDPAVRLMLAVHPDGRITAATSWLPTYRNGRISGWTLDFMRRRDGSTNGEMEMLIAETVLRAQREGLEFVSLSAAPLSRIAPGTAGSEGAARLLEGLGSRLEKLYHFRSLLTYKLKFAPELRPLYLAYSDASAIPSVGIALVRAYLPGLTARQLLAMTRELADRPREEALTR